MLHPIPCDQINWRNKYCIFNFNGLSHGVQLCCMMYKRFSRPMKSHVIEVKGNYLLLYLWCSHSLISQGITHPSIYPPVLSSMHRPLYSLSVLPSISCRTKPPIRPPTVSTQVSRWAYYFFSRKQKPPAASVAITDPKTQTVATPSTRRWCMNVAWIVGGGNAGVRIKDREGPSVRSHWGQTMAATFTKANSPEEQSTSPVAVDYSIITSTSLTVSHSKHSLFKIHTACRMVGAIKC